MYQGCNKTAISSHNSIAEGFYELLQEKEYAKITASEICKKSGVSRQTFYSLFSSKENIVAYILSKEYAFDPVEECSCGRPTLRELSRGFSSFIVQKSGFIYLLEKNNIIYLLQETLYCSFSSCMGAEQDVSVTEQSAPVTEHGAPGSPPEDVTLDFIASGLTTIAKHYVKHQQSVSCDELEKMIYVLFSGEYLKLG